MSFSAPSTYTSISYMYLDALIFGVIAWYLDNIIIVINLYLIIKQFILIKFNQIDFSI